MNLPRLPKRTRRRSVHNRYKDKLNSGHSTLVPYMPNESWNERHDRRRLFALGHVKEIEQWCTKHQWSMEIKNNGHHWLFLTKKKKAIEWWPSSGKLIIGKQWKEGIHCHDYVQLLKVFELTK